MSKRSKIVNKLVEIVNTNLDGVTYTSNVYDKAENKLTFYDEVDNFPYVSIVAGGENRQYLPSNFKWGFLQVIIRIYVKNEYPQVLLEQILDDLENLIDDNNNLEYDVGETTELISILSIDTDQGLLTPYGVGEMIIQIQYDL